MSVVLATGIIVLFGLANFWLGLQAGCWMTIRKARRILKGENEVAK